MAKVKGLGKRVHEWQSEDKNRKKFLTTWPGGPKWDKVISRTTYDMETGRIIEHLEIDKRTSATMLHRRLPLGVTWIKTVLMYTGEEKGKTSLGNN